MYIDDAKQWVEIFYMCTLEKLSVNQKGILVFFWLLSTKILIWYKKYLITPETRFSEILDLMNEHQLPFSYVTLYLNSI